MERLYLALAAAGHCADMWFQIDVDGAVDVDDLRRAACDLSAVEPRLASVVRRGPLGYRWQPAAEPERLLHRAIRTVPNAAEGAASFDVPLDLAREPGFRLLVSPRPEGGQRLSVTCNHALGDGRGVLVLLRLLGERMAGAPLQPAPPPFRLRDHYRDLPVRAWPGLMRSLLDKTRETVLRHGPEIATWPGDAAPAGPGPERTGRQVVALPADLAEWRRRWRAQGRPATAVLIAAVLHACRQTWGDTGGLPVRVTLPVALGRQSSTAWQNGVVGLSVDLNPACLDDGDGLIAHLGQSFARGRRQDEALRTMTRFLLPSVLPPQLRERLVGAHLDGAGNRRESVMVTWLHAAGETLPVFPGADVVNIAAWAHTHSPPGLRFSVLSGPVDNLMLSYTAATVDDAGAAVVLDRVVERLRAS